MARELLDALNHMRIGLETSEITSGIIDNKMLENDSYLQDLHKRVCIETWQNLFATRYAINVKSIDLLALCGYDVLCDDEFNVYLCFGKFQIKVLNPLNVCAD